MNTFLLYITCATLLAISLILCYVLYRAKFPEEKDLDGKNFKTNFGRIVRKIKEYTLPVLLVFGLILLTTYYFFKFFSFTTFKQHEEDFKELFAIALAITSSGIFLAVLKWFQFMGIFRKEFQDIIRSSEFDNKLEKSVSDIFYSDEFLKKQSDLEHLWRKVNRCFFKNEFPDEFAERIETRIRDLLFYNRKLSHYFKNFVCTLSITLEGEYLTIEEITEAKVIRQDLKEFDLELKYHVKRFGAEDAQSSVHFNSLHINKISQDIANVDESGSSDYAIQKRITIKPTGHLQYDMISNITLIQNIKDYEYSLNFERFVDYFRVDVKHSPNLNIIFNSIGNDEFEEPLRIEAGFVKVFTGLLLPEKGFRLIFVRK
jgi:hypothetical protein